MVIDTRTIGFGMTDAILRHARSRVESALGFAAPHVLRVTVRSTTSTARAVAAPTSDAGSWPRWVDTAR